MSRDEKIFECQQCGHCCHGETTVSLDEADRRRMCAHLGMPEQEVAEKFWRISGNIVQMKTRDGHCIFYDQGCSVHPGRPWRCRQWPLHPSLLKDEANLSAIRDSCPGINRSMDYREFCTEFAPILDGSSEK